MPVHATITPFQWMPNMPHKVAFKIEVTTDMLDIRSQEDRQALAMAILESIEQGACQFQQFVDELRKANQLEVFHWDYPFIPLKDRP